MNEKEEEPKCICPEECDCQKPPNGDDIAGVSNSCPVHNLNPQPVPGCPVCDPEDVEATIDPDIDGIIRFLREMPEQEMMEAVKVFYDSTNLAKVITWDKFVEKNPDRVPFFSVGIGNVFHWMRVRFGVINPEEMNQSKAKDIEQDHGAVTDISE